MTDDKRLIEDYLPIQAISKESSREKSTRKGHISTLHLWWARRPLVACRAAVYGALVPASRFAWTKERASKSQGKSKPGKKGSAVDLGRGEAEEFVTKLCQYPGEPAIIAQAQQHILEAHAERLSQEQGKMITVTDIVEGRAPRPRVLDLFAGGGAIPLEAIRLGCEAYAVDLNPVAHVIELCTLVYPQRFGKPDQNTSGMTGRKNAKGETTWGGLAEEVRYWGNWVLERVQAEVGDLYPPIPDPKAKKHDLVPENNARLFEDSRAQEKLKVPSGYLMPMAYLWTRTIKCKNRACGATVPLVRQTWLCKKKDRYVALKMIAKKGEKRVQFKVVEAATASGLGFDPEGFSSGGNATCSFCGTVSDNDYVKAEGCADRIGFQVMAAVCTHPDKEGKRYVGSEQVESYIPERAVMMRRIGALSAISGLSLPAEPLPPKGTLGFRVQAYGIRTWGDLYLPRQGLCLLTFASAIQEVHRTILEFGSDHDRAKAVTTFLGLAVDRVAMFGNTLCAWYYQEQAVSGIFSRQAVPMLWDFAEISLHAEISGGIAGGLSRIADAISHLQGIDRAAHAVRVPAQEVSSVVPQCDAIVTDPPYYDNIPYADLSDLFYVWLKRTIGPLYAEHFATELTPKKNEAIAEPARHRGDKDAAKKSYEKMMGAAFRECAKILKSSGSLVIVYAHKTTLGWSTLVEALRKAGFTVMEAWAVDTEGPGRLRAHGSAALASSIFLVARKRQGNTIGSYETDVRPQLEAIVRERVGSLWKMGITGADLVIAAVGAGLRAFTQFESVEYANGEEVPAERFLAEVEGVVLETLLERIFGVSRSGVSAVDGPSRFYVLWRYTYKAADLDAGEAIVFTYSQPVELDGQGGVSTGRRPLVEKKKSQYRLYDFSDRGDDEMLGIPNEDGDPAPLIDVLHRTLWLMENKPRSLAGFLDEARPDRERLRLVAQALAGPGLKGKSDGDSKTLLTTTTAEQAALGKLLANWRSLIDSRLEEFSLR